VLAAATALAVSAVLAGTVSPADATTSGQAAPPCALTSATPLALQYPHQAPPAASLLHRLADRLRPVPSDTDTGRYAYARLRMQAADSTFDDPCVVTLTAHANEERWRADDGSGQVTGTPWHLDPAHPPAVETTVYPAGELPGVVAGPVPTDPAALAAALDAATNSVQATDARVRPLGAADNARRQRHTGTAARVRAVADLNAWHCTDRLARRAVLLVLADVARLAYRGTVAGYPGAFAVSVDSDDWRDILVLDRVTGVVLAYEQVLLRNGQPLGVRTPYMNARTVYAGRGRSSRAGVAPSHDSTGQP